MKKKLLMLLFLFSIVLIPTRSLAAEKEPVNIYLFRGEGCGFCKKFLNYVNDTLLEKYDGKINIVAYEVWYNTENASLMQQVASFLEDDASGVPYIIIGDQSFVGYAESYNSQIEKAIDDLYDSKDRYDVFEKMGNKVDLSKNESKTIEEVFNDEDITFNYGSNENVDAEVSTYSKNSSDEKALLIWNLVFMVVGFVVLIILNVKNKKDILNEIEILKKNKYKK